MTSTLLSGGGLLTPAGTAVAFEIPDDLRFGQIVTLYRNWNRDDCDVLGREQIVCTVESFILCEDFFRRDLCERVGLYPDLIESHDYVLYGQRVVEGEWYPSDFAQYRLVSARSFDDRYYPRLLVFHLETRHCWWMPARPLWCNRDWTPQYHVIAELDTTRPNVVASGVLSWSR
jgi:hypothetical protein